MDIKEIKKENKELRKSLSKDDKNFVMDVSYYIDQYQLSPFEYHDLMNRILQDLLKKVDKKKCLWDIVEDPIEYCDHFLMGKEKKVKSLFDRVFIYIILFITLLGLNSLMNQYFSFSVLPQIDKSKLLITSGMIIRTIAILVFVLVEPEMSKRNLFDQSRYKVKFISIYTVGLFLALMFGSSLENVIMFSLDKYIVFGFVFIGTAILYIKRRIA